MLRSWRAATPLYHAWFDHLTSGRESVIINDSSMFGHVLSRYRRAHVLTVQVVHSNYLDKMRKDSIHPDRFQTMHRLDWFDLVAALTPGQAEDLVTSGLVHPSRVVAIPNAALPTPVDTTEERDPLHGVYIARFWPEKRTSHAIRATQRAHTPETPIRMDIFGDGPLRDSLHSITQDLRADEYIRFHGHDPRAREKFKEASFSVLSSLSEGHPLVLLESMAAGCIPIAYDIKYGPSIMIEDGIDGFLVLSGDVHALANRIQQVATMDSDQLHRMRRAAVMKSQMFSPSRIVAEWSSALQTALTEKRDSRPLEDRSLRAELVEAQLNPSALLLTIAVSTRLTELSGAEARLSWISRTSEALGGLAVDSSRISEDGRTLMEVTLPLAELDEERRTVCDLYLDVVSPDFAARTRVTCPSLEEPVRGKSVRLYRTVHGNLSLTLR
jgi:poly(glycerol-phosphate) alpha-glucosyltransferase